MAKYKYNNTLKQVIWIISSLVLNSCFAFHKKKTIEGTIVNNTNPDTWEGVNIKRSIATSLVYRNNSITSINAAGYMLQAGDEEPGFKNNNLDNEIITGNQLVWKGNDSLSITHGIFTGYNLNAVIKYNYLKNIPMAIVRKSNGMTDTSGGVAYNIIIDPKVAVVIKGMNGVNILNNTFYSSKTSSQTWRGIVDIYSNVDKGLNTPSKGNKILNNIFYTKHRVLNIYIYDESCLSGFESDYNVFWCEDGEPLFKIGNSIKTFTEWQALGYDKHSVLLNPDFSNTSILVPRTRLDYGTYIGHEWEMGLSIDAKWGNVSPDTAGQNGKWQVGAYVFREKN